jgi:purine-nucleoside phosphorylase
MAALLMNLGGCAAPAAQKQEVVVEQSYDERLQKCKEQIEAITDFKPQVVIALGTGLGDFVKSLDVKKTISYKDIDGWPMSTAPEHAGNLVFAEYRGLKLAVMQGRLHGYEGYSEQEVVLPLRVLHMLGADTAILSNAVGSLNPDFRVGEFVCVEDQISSFVPSPLIGKNNDELGSRFVGMTDAFDKDMRDTVLKLGEQNNIPVHSGVYIQVTGPQFETPAEIKMYRSLGADTIAMSMADEVLAARHMGMKVCAINCISNMAAGMEEEGFDEGSVEENMKGVVPNFQTLVNGLLDSLVDA